MRCNACGRPLTGSWSKGRNARFAYYHCRGECRAINVAKAKLEGLFVDELARLQPSEGYMRLVKARVVHVWDRARADLKETAEAVERRVKAIRQRIDRLDNALLYEQSIDIETYDRHKERLNEELTLARMDRHATELEEMDVEGILGFAERVLPRAADLCRAPRTCWVQASLEQRHRLQQLFFLRGLRSMEKRSFEPL